MKPKLFFRYCRELVVIRWIVWFSVNDGIRLTPLVEYGQKSMDFTRPLCAVAIDLFGPRDEFWFDQGVAAGRLGLFPEFARLLHTASRSPFGLAPREIEVREELLHALEQGKRFEIKYRRRC